MLDARLQAIPAAAPDRAVRAVDAILAEGAARGASDIHLEPGPERWAVRFRIDGVLQAAATFPAAFGPNVVARLKVLAELLTYRTDIPQDGAIRDPGGRGEQRVSTFPTIHGEKVVVRLFRSAATLASVEELGLDTDTFTSLTDALQERGGALLLTGPSGSGKTTTIYACLRRLAADGLGRQIVTIEDPVEQSLEGVTQSQVQPGREFDFALGLRSLLRQDPDVLMVGEIRDRATAGVAFEAALTGHLLISTLHAGSACGVFARLLEMGVEPYLLTGSVRGVLNQRLVRRLCPDCRGAGCPACHGGGFRGRMLLAEFLAPTPALRAAVLARADAAALEAVAGASGWRSIRDAAASAVAAGVTTVDECRRVLGPGWDAPAKR